MLNIGQEHILHIGQWPERKLCWCGGGKLTNTTLLTPHWFKEIVISSPCCFLVEVNKTVWDMSAVVMITSHTDLDLGFMVMARYAHRRYVCREHVYIIWNQSEQFIQSYPTYSHIHWPRFHTNLRFWHAEHVHRIWKQSKQFMNSYYDDKIARDVKVI